MLVLKFPKKKIYIRLEYVALSYIWGRKDIKQLKYNTKDSTYI
jgi:hypothetical protein